MMLSMPVLYLISMLAFFTAVPMTGPSRAAMFSNAEPVFTLLLAAAVLGEVLTSLKLVGAGMVVGAIIIIQLARARAVPAGRDE